MGVSMTQFFWVFLLMIILTVTNATSRRQNPEVQNLLKRLNKSPIKSIKSPDGDIIDCVYIYKQPAFDHPLLKNHTIQMKPSSFPKGDMRMSNDEGSHKPIKQLWHLKGSCPEGTIPIRRVTKEDILRASSVQRFGMKEHGTIPSSSNHVASVNDDHEYAAAHVQGDTYYGSKAIINVWTPMVQERNDFSLSQIWLAAGPGDKINTIEAGWQVYPQIYNDNNTRIFIYWTSDGYKHTGCYNLRCSGFVQISKEIAVGSTIAPISSYGGTQYEVTFLVWKDTKTANWWLVFGDKQLVGYWPSSLFTYLKDSASVVHWGGEITNTKVDGKHSTTQMGSGHFSEEGFARSSYFRNLRTVDDTNHLIKPDGVETDSEHSSCYDIRFYKGSDKNWDVYFFYGGPGRNLNCP